jgi:hypothetical protein
MPKAADLSAVDQRPAETRMFAGGAAAHMLSFKQYYGKTVAARHENNDPGQQSFCAPLGARITLALLAKLATNRRAALQELWRGRELQNQLPVETGLQCVRESNGWLPNPNLRSDEQAQVESNLFAGGTSSLEVQPCSWELSSLKSTPYVARTSLSTFQPTVLGPVSLGLTLKSRPEPGNEASLLNP